MSDAFEGYERQYCELSANLSRKCNSAAALHDGGKAEILFQNDLDMILDLFLRLKVYANLLDLFILGEN